MNIVIHISVHHKISHWIEHMNYHTHTYDLLIFFSDKIIVNYGQAVNEIIKIEIWAEISK